MDDFTEYDIKPRGFNNYMRYYGQHLNKALCEYMCRQQFDTQYTKDDLINICSNNGYTCDEKNIYDKVYLYNYYRNLLLGNGIDDEQHLMKVISTVCEKEKGLIFNRILADSAKLGISIEWEDFI